HEDPRPFIAIAEWLIGRGLSAPEILAHDLDMGLLLLGDSPLSRSCAPEILAHDLDKGLLLLGDFGSARLRETLDTDPRRERELYELATDVLVHLHGHPPMAGLKPHGLEQWLDELALFTDWYCPAVGLEADVDAYRAAWR